MIFSDILNIFIWWNVFFLIGITFFPLTSKIFNSFLDKGYIFSKILGLLLISYSVYVLGTFNILKFELSSILFIWLLLFIPQLFLIKSIKDKINKKNLILIIAEEIIFFIALLIWSYIRGFNPDIHDLEKFMDFGFINSILRTEYFPPRDMWFTPLPINYYYFGHLFTAVATKISHIPSFITFNLMLSTIFAFTFTMSFSIGVNLINKIKTFSLIKSIIIGLMFGYIVSLAGNLQTIYAFFTHYNSEWPKPIWELGLAISTFPNSYWYPSATRFIYHTIHEFPSYSFVVADLHGHVLDIPIVLTILSIFLIFFFSNKIKLPILILFSFLVSIAYMTNAWDGLIYLGLGILIVLILSLINSNGVFKKRIKYILLEFSKGFTTLFVSFFIFTFAFNKSFAPFATGIGLNCSPEYLIKIGKLGPFIFEKGFCQVTPPWQLLILYGFFIFMIFSLVIFLIRKKIIISDIFVLTISVFSLLLILAPEIVYLKDIYAGHFRANTMFKLAYQAFIMLSLSSTYALVRILSELKEIKHKKYYPKFFYLVFIIFAVPLLFLIIIYPYFAIPSGYKDLNNRVGLNGIKYLETLHPQDYKAINWINENIAGQPVMLEAQGDSYTDFARISANTGLPTVLGWTVHEWLWRGSYDIPSARFPDISSLYESNDISEAKKIIDKYDISYVYIGKLENEKYNISEEKFNILAEVVFSINETKIYKIN